MTKSKKGTRYKKEDSKRRLSEKRFHLELKSDMPKYYTYHTQYLDNYSAKKGPLVEDFRNIKSKIEIISSNHLGNSSFFHMSAETWPVESGAVLGGAAGPPKLGLFDRRHHKPRHRTQLGNSKRLAITMN